MQSLMLDRVNWKDFCAYNNCPLFIYRSLYCVNMTFKCVWKADLEQIYRCPSLCNLLYKYLHVVE